MKQGKNKVKPPDKPFINPFKGKKARVFELCYWAIKHADGNKISPYEVDIEETADVPQSIREIKVYNSAIDIGLSVNGKNCQSDGWEP